MRTELGGRDRYLLSCRESTTHNEVVGMGGEYHDFCDEPKVIVESYSWRVNRICYIIAVAVVQKNLLSS